MIAFDFNSKELPVTNRKSRLYQNNPKNCPSSSFRTFLFPKCLFLTAHSHNRLTGQTFSFSATGKHVQVEAQVKRLFENLIVLIYLNFYRAPIDRLIWCCFYYLQVLLLQHWPKWPRWSGYGRYALCARFVQKAVFCALFSNFHNTR